MKRAKFLCLAILAGGMSGRQPAAANSDIGGVVASANGTFVDLAERDAIKRELPSALVYSAKPALGESVGASALWQTIAGAQALRTKRLPLMPHSPQHVGLNFPTPSEMSCAKAIILSCGLNQQVAGLRLSI